MLWGWTACAAMSLALAAADDAAKDDLAKFQGTWRLVSAETDGAPAPKERIDGVTVTIAGKTHTVRVKDQVAAKDVAFELDPSKSPREVTDTVGEGKVIRGIYKIEGDTLTSCVAPVNAARPTEFSAPAGSKRTLRVFRREPAGDPTKADYALFQGSWTIESMEIGGKSADIAELRGVPLVLKDKTFAQGPAKGTYKIDATKSPRTIDLTFTEGPPKGISIRGIYELDATTYKLCIARPGSDRPKRFDSKAEDGGAIQILKKTKPPGGEGD